MKENPENDRSPLMSDENKDAAQAIPSMGPAEYIKDRLESQINYFDRKSSWNQKKYKKLKWVEIVLAASIPVLIGISSMKLFDVVVFTITVTELSADTGSVITFEDDLLTLNGLLNIIAAVAGIFLVVINKVFELEAYFTTWKSYRTTATELQMERIKYLTKVDPYDDEDAFSQLVENVESILNKENQSWKERTKPKTNDLVKKATAALDEKAAELKELAYEREIEKIKRGGNRRPVKRPPSKKPTNKKKDEPVTYNDPVEPEEYNTEAYDEPVYDEPVYDEEIPMDEGFDEPPYDEGGDYTDEDDNNKELG